MATVNDIYAFLNDLAPVRYQMDFDNAGFLVGDGSTAVERVLLALDITNEVIAEAAALHAQLIVSHHPLIFTPLRRATADDLTGRKVLALARNGIAAICMHTNLDIADGGVNDALMAALGAEVTGGLEPSGTARRWQRADLRPCRPAARNPWRCRIFCPMSLIGCTPMVCAMSMADARWGCLRSAAAPAAVCWSLLHQKGCDTFVTADVKYDRFLAAKELGINLIDADHFCTENVIIPVLYEKLRARFRRLLLTVSRVHAQTAQTYCP